MRVLLIGSGGVGKTSWLNNLQNGTFNPGYVPTNDPIDVPITLPDGRCITFTDYDGQTFRYEAGVQVLALSKDLNASDAVLIFFAKDNIITFHRAKGAADRCKALGKPYVMVRTKEDVATRTELGTYDVKISTKMGINIDDPVKFILAHAV